MRTVLDIEFNRRLSVLWLRPKNSLRNLLYLQSESATKVPSALFKTKGVVT